MNTTTRIQRWSAFGSKVRLRERVSRLVRRSWRLCAMRDMQALVLCASCMLLYLLVIGPERARLDTALRQTAAGNLTRPENIARPRSAATKLSVFYARFPSQSAFPDALDQLFKTAASHALSVNEGAYTVTRASAGRLVRFQIVLPLHGTYPQVRNFLAALAHDVPGMALENARFERHDIGDPVLDVKLRLVLFLAPLP